MRGSESKRDARLFHGKPATKRPMWSLVGCVAKLVRPIQNASLILPKGMTVRVTYAGRAGVEIESDACPFCGVRVIVTKVRPEDLEIIREPRGAR